MGRGPRYPYFAFQAHPYCRVLQIELYEALATLEMASSPYYYSKSMQSTAAASAKWDTWGAVVGPWVENGVQATKAPNYCEPKSLSVLMQ